MIHVFRVSQVSAILCVGFVLSGLLGLLFPITHAAAFSHTKSISTESFAQASNPLTPTPTRVFATPLPPQTTIYSEAKPRTYVVENGDTLWTIAQKMYGNGSKYPIIQHANNLGDRAKLQTGMSLLIPPAESETGTGGPRLAPVAVFTPEPAPTALTKPISVAVPVPTSVVVVDTPNNSSTVTVPPATTPAESKKAKDSLVGYYVLALNLGSGFFFIASLLCSYMSFDIYWRSRGYAHRRQISLRIRSGLYS